MIEPGFLRLLVCPSTRESLREATAAELAAVNAAIQQGTARNRGGAAVTEAVSGGLVTASGAVLYPIQDGIPILLSGEAIPLRAAP
ncbi:MAG: hypothetical protein JNM25_17295 [Planctomycetes bacterium]|nr:hypothetical protein [Planctomycetota bacterium]